MLYRDSKVVYPLLCNYKPVNQPQWFKPRDCVINLLSVFIQLSSVERGRACVNDWFFEKPYENHPQRENE